MVDSAHSESSVLPVLVDAGRPTSTFPNEGQSDTQILTGAMKDFIEELRANHIEQSKSLQAVLDRWSTVGNVEQPSKGDLKTTFWMTYKTLAANFDEEMLEKYRNDLDTSVVVFAGLFSAVSSAFIIQIQPQLQPDPNATTQALLLLLLRNTTGASIPYIQMPLDPGPPILIVFVQALLYLSLGSSLFAALLAFDAKQWLRAYGAAGNRGTVQERGLERQRKLDGWRYWKFDLIMAIFPLLLPFSLLLFSMALSIYLWTIHRALAGFCTGMVALVFITYAAMTVSPLLWPDSPFQTALSWIIGSFWIMPRFPQIIRRFAEMTCWHISRSWSSAILPILPRFLSAPSLSAQPNPIFYEHPGSMEVSAIIWALETSNNDNIVDVAMAMASYMQWPISLDPQFLMHRLFNVFNSCHNGKEILAGVEDRATSCIRTYVTLEMLQTPDFRSHFTSLPGDFWCSYPHEERTTLAILQNRGSFHTVIAGIPDCVISQWALRLIATEKLPEEDLSWLLRNFQIDEASRRNLSLLADFLFCVNSFFARPHPHDLILMDKSQYCVTLTTQLFKHLAECRLDLDLKTKILDKILEFSGHSLLPEWGGARYMSAAYDLCSRLGLSTEVKSALRLVRMDPSQRVPSYPIMVDPTWAFRALHTMWDMAPRDLDLIGDLLQVVVCCRNHRAKPTPNALRTVVWALQSDVEADKRPTPVFAALILLHAEDWFTDPDLQAILLEGGYIWTLLGTYAHLDLGAYISLAWSISKTREWQTVLSEDLPSWLGSLSQLLVNGSGEQKHLFCSVISRVWNVAEADHFGEETPLAMAFTAVGNVWNRFDFLQVRDINYIVRLVQCTGETMVCAKWQIVNASQNFSNVIVRFRESIAAAAASARDRALIIDGETHLVSQVQVILYKLVERILVLQNQGSSFDDGTWSHYWNDFQWEIRDDMSVLRQSVETAELPDFTE
ncbi:hypothetical protein DFH09DRAFT_1477281 [Mycena vulgaris]|nr:hypothetical protein DFH09DRAFT_1477281 [Mycena vulgaris]